jgi:hypothetical protein
MHQQQKGEWLECESELRIGVFGTSMMDRWWSRGSVNPSMRASPVRGQVAKCL